MADREFPQPLGQLRAWVTSHSAIKSIFMPKLGPLASVYSKVLSSIAAKGTEASRPLLCGKPSGGLPNLLVSLHTIPFLSPWLLAHTNRSHSFWVFMGTKISNSEKFWRVYFFRGFLYGQVATCPYKRPVSTSRPAPTGRISAENGIRTGRKMDVFFVAGIVVL